MHNAVPDGFLRCPLMTQETVFRYLIVMLIHVIQREIYVSGYDSALRRKRL